jgi:alpha-N-arabinofuranosidase
MINYFQAFVCAAQFLLIGTGVAATFNCTVTVSDTEPIGEIPPGIYGQYLEHVEAHENTIYPALWDDKSTHSNDMGIRTDVAAAVKSLGTSVVRWPGGCFADVYHWEDAIGPRALRQPKPNLHWGGMESNMFGTDEFLHWCRLAGVEPYINVNLGSGTLDEALRWLEYANGSPDTRQGHRRADNGTTEPYGVRYWGIGNETWGPWEMGHADADTYGTSLSLWAKAMRKQDPSIRILGVGSEEGNDRDWDCTGCRRNMTVQSTRLLPLPRFTLRTGWSVRWKRLTSLLHQWAAKSPSTSP